MNKNDELEKKNKKRIILFSALLIILFDAITIAALTVSISTISIFVFLAVSGLFTGFSIFVLKFLRFMYKVDVKSKIVC